MKVNVIVKETELEGDHGDIPGLILTCERCSHEVEVYGTEAASARLGAIMLREECPNKESNFYYILDWTGDDK